eukprot:TRINITY_DN43830_c0_g1_i1.p1 TRINITY_DN43830_c0_g1~~TRINITY_DN43830_c0_g1_i1.p1  ORF type:complete len:585 (+),score=106.86 TRINITY_DN43830_c0_g1_i1:205-1959(+)
MASYYTQARSQRAVAPQESNSNVSGSAFLPWGESKDVLSASNDWGGYGTVDGEIFGCSPLAQSRQSRDGNTAKTHSSGGQSLYSRPSVAKNGISNGHIEGRSAGDNSFSSIVANTNTDASAASVFADVSERKAGEKGIQISSAASTRATTCSGMVAPQATSWGIRGAETDSSWQKQDREVRSHFDDVRANRAMSRPQSAFGEELREDIQRQVRTWSLSQAGQTASLGLCLRNASALRRHGVLELPVESFVRAHVVKPVVEALRQPVASETEDADLLRNVGSLGAFSAEALTELQMCDTSCSEFASFVSTTTRWREVAHAELRRQGMLRSWEAWDEKEVEEEVKNSAGCVSSTSLAWLAFRVVVGGSCGGDQPGFSGIPRELTSSGEVFGRAAATTEEVNAGLANLLPPLFKENCTKGEFAEEQARCAERRALSSLAVRILQALPTDTDNESDRVEGDLMLYSSRPPTISGMYSMRQFLQLFPSIRLRVAYDSSCGRTFWTEDDVESETSILVIGRQEVSESNRGDCDDGILSGGSRPLNGSLSAAKHNGTPYRSSNSNGVANGVDDGGVAGRSWYSRGGSAGAS